MREQSMKQKLQGTVPVGDPLTFGGSAASDNESHDVTLNPIPQDLRWAESKLSISIEYHLTARITNTSLSRRDLSLLLSVLNYQMVTFGVNLNMLIAAYEIYFRLLGNKTRGLEIKDSYIRLSVSLSEIIFQEIKSLELSLSSEELVQLRPGVKKLLQRYIMEKRTYKSRYMTWRPEKYFVIKAVPVDTLTERQRKDTEPYSGYCKGYGESHGNAHQSRTRRSAELDGEQTGYYATDEEDFLFIRCTDPVHLLSESLLIRYENFRIEN